MHLPISAESLRDAVRRAFSNPSLWVIALCLVAGEAGCNAQARSYPDGVTVNLALDGSSLSDDGEGLGSALEGTNYFIHNGTVLVADGVALITGQRDASGAEAVGAVLGTWVAAIPTALLLLVIGAWLLPGYYRHQVGGETKHKSYAPGTELFRRMLAVRTMSALAVLTAAVLGAIPGIALLTIAGLQDLSVLAVAGMLVTVGGTVGGWLYVQAGVLFADREAALGNIGSTQALRRSWERARGRRIRRLAWSISAWTIEAVGSLGWFAWFVGFLTHPVARAISDTLMTQLYLEEASHA